MKQVCRFLVACVALLAIVILVFNVVSVLKTGKGNGGTVNWGEDLETLAKELSRGAVTDKERVLNFYNWIIENIEYDYNYDGVYQHESISKTLRTQKGICFDYANLFAAMCRSQGLSCYVVDGYQKGNPLEKHTWNRVYYDNSWWNVDVTNDAISLRKGKTLYGFHPLADYRQEDEDYVITRIY